MQYFLWAMWDVLKSLAKLSLLILVIFLLISGLSSCATHRCINGAVYTQLELSDSVYIKSDFYADKVCEVK